MRLIGQEPRSRLYSVLLPVVFGTCQSVDPGHAAARPTTPQAAGQKHAAPILNRLASAKSVEFTAKVFYRKPKENGLTSLEPRWTFKVSAKRPNYLRLGAVPFPATRPSSEWGEPEDHPVLAYTTLISDGKTRIDIAPSRREYQLSDVEPALDQISGMYASALVPIMDLFAQPGSYMKRVGSATIGKTVVQLYSATVSGGPPGRGTTQFVLSIDPKNRLPIRISEWHIDEAGKRAEVLRVDLSGFQLDKDLPARLFDATPANGYKRVGVSPARP